MPWIDDETREAVERRLREVHGFPADYRFGKCHVDLGPAATVEKIIEQLADSTADIARRRTAGEKPNGPARCNIEPIDVREFVKNLPKSE